MTGALVTQPEVEAPIAGGESDEAGTAPSPGHRALRLRVTDLPRQLVRVRSLLRLQPFGQATPEERSNERYRRAALSATTGGMVRVIGIVAVAVTVPLTLGYLGPERYGFWVTVTSLAAVLQFSDLGLGNGLVTMIAEAPDRDERSNVRTLVSSALALLVVSGALVLVVSLVAARVVNWPAVFDLSPATAHEAAPAIAIFLACLALNIPLGLVTNVQNGLQEGFVANIWLAIGAVLGVSSVVVAALLEASVPVLVVAGSVPPLIALAGNALHFFGHRHPDLRPSLGSVRLSTAMALLRLGALFFVLQIAVAVGYSSDSLIIAAIRGAPEVTAYAVPFRLFVVFPMVVALIVSPLWPAYGEAIARRDMAWVRRTLHRSLAVVAAITVPCCVLLTIAGPWIIDAWTGGRLHPSRLLLAGLALWAVVGSLGSATSMFLNAARVVRLQVVTASTMAITNVILSVVLVERIGAAGAVWATLVSYLLFVAIPYCIRVPRLLDRLADTAGAPL